jgi:hypothetical protein
MQMVAPHDRSLTLAPLRDSGQRSVAEAPVQQSIWSQVCRLVLVLVLCEPEERTGIDSVKSVRFIVGSFCPEWGDESQGQRSKYLQMVP